MIDLTSYHVLLVNSSAGKDSQAMLDVVATVADGMGCKDRITVVHADLGRMEWPGTRQLAEKQAKHYGVRFEVVRREQGDLLQQVEQRGMWPDAARRYCTSDQKRGPVQRLMTRLVSEFPPGGRPVRILNMLGLRAQESRARALKPAFTHNERASNGKRHVDDYLPIHGWTEDQVWARIKKSGVPYHQAYDLGMPRLSCRFCILASKSALVLAAQLNPELAQEYVDLEAKINHRFRNDLSMAEIVETAKASPPIEKVDGWAA